jgi:hypothetical protein
MRKKIREIKIGESSFSLCDKNIVQGTLVGDISQQAAIDYNYAITQLVTGVEGPINVLIDNRKIGDISLEAVRIFRILLKNHRFGKIAVFKARPVSSAFASFICSITGKRGLRMFKTREDAIAWLEGPNTASSAENRDEILEPT